MAYRLVLVVVVWEVGRRDVGGAGGGREGAVSGLRKGVRSQGGSGKEVQKWVWSRGGNGYGVQKRVRSQGETGTECHLVYRYRGEEGTCVGYVGAV